MYATSIDVAHAKIHERQFFDFQKVFLDVANNDYVRVSLRPNNKEMHLVITVVAEGKSYIKSYINTTYTADGTLETSFNRYIGAAVADTTVYSQGTVNVLGTERFDTLLPAGTGRFSSGATASSRIESVLDAGLELTLEVQNVSATTGDIGITVEWYEKDED